jgi:dihydroflavonol-4-reductase
MEIPQPSVMKTVGIIGGSGFIGSYITKKFLEETYFCSFLTEQNYKVRVSATAITRKEKYQHLFGFKKSRNLQIIPLNVLHKEDLRNFMQGCDILIHCGTPFILASENPQREILKPTIEGTENILQLIRETPGLSKVVFVGSVAAHNTNFPFPADGHSGDHLYTEDDTPFFAENAKPYAKAKYFADQAVRKFVKENPNPGFEIVTVSPVLVAGLAISGRTDFTSTELQFIVKNRLASDPFIEMLFDENPDCAVVDVNDVAEGIFKAATIDGLHGKHYLLSSESYRLSDLSRLLNNQPPKVCPRITVSSHRATRDLGIRFKSVDIALGQFAELFELDSTV